MIREVNFDGLVGPTHNYGGLSFGNIASTKNKLSESSPQLAALQGLEKMKFLMERGVLQGVLPPHDRPSIKTFRALGFVGTEQAVLKSVFKTNYPLFSQCTSASAMWAANAGMVSPSADTQDGKVHFTPANLISNFHRSLETDFTTKILRKIFHHQTYFKVHDSLPNSLNFSDEGAANYCRITKEHGQRGLELFVYGSNGLPGLDYKYPARQAKEANNAHIRNHLLNSKYIFNLEQNSRVINQGVFHNDVISVANENVFLYHEFAFADKKEVDRLRIRARQLMPNQVYFIKISNKDLSVAEAVRTYLFNSQIITLSKNKMLLLAPLECEKSKKVNKVIHQILSSDNPIQEVKYLNLRESMRNGGGPACLRLRVVLTEKELSAISGRVILTNELHQELVDWVKRFYCKKLLPKDLSDYKLFEKNKNALDALTKILKLGNIYDFQKKN